jgi:hypothetical protein
VSRTEREAGRMLKPPNLKNNSLGQRGASLDRPIDGPDFDVIMDVSYTLRTNNADRGNEKIHDQKEGVLTMPLWVAFGSQIIRIGLIQ